MPSNNSKSLTEDYFDKMSYDEMFDKHNQVKTTWKTLLENLNAIGGEELTESQKEVDWNLAENGITYNIYNDPKGLNRPWNLNVVPLLMEKSEWHEIQKGIQQRAQLLDLVVKDIYSKRELIKNGIIPFEVIYGHRGFLRQCDGLDLTTPNFLSCYSVDLSRGPDGRMWVVNDRTQAPSGMGYALENRTVLKQVLPKMYNNLHVAPQDQFFNEFRQLLVNAAPDGKADPTIVVLTPGPHNETYFEHAYLASYFGYPLVRGSDLVVRNGKLWLKSLKELKQVDVIYRRVDDVFVDPLELREDSYLGVAGLLNVVRNKNVSIINPVGVGIIENSGLIPFMPAIAEYFLKEPLILPQIATWWCGQEKELKLVLDNLSKLVIKRIDRSNRESIVFAEFLNAKELQTLKERILKRPHLFVAQEKIRFSTIPNFSKNKLEPRNMVCRAFAVAKDQSYHVMCGGLVRVSSSVEELRVSNQRGGTSKDFCIIDKQQAFQSSTFHTSKNHILAGLDNLPSHTAENLYWAGRYVGRALVNARHLRMVLKQFVNIRDINEAYDCSKLNVLLSSVTQLTNTYPGFVGEGKMQRVVDIRKELIDVVLNKNRAGSLAHTLSLFNNSYYNIRNLWSMDMWRVFDSINKLWDNILAEDFQVVSFRKIIKSLDQLVMRLIAFMGLVEESILVDQGLLLYFLGLNIETALLKVNLVQSMLTVATTENHTQYDILESVLQSFESLNIYRYSYRSHINIENVLSLLVLNPKYARSIAFLVNRIQKDIKCLPHSNSAEGKQDYEIAIEKTLTILQTSNSEHLSEVSPNRNFTRENLKVSLEELSDLLFDTTKGIADTYFNHVNDQSQLTLQNYS